MLNLSSPVNAIDKIGPKYKKLLENLEIYTIEDLLYHFPFRYDDFSEIKSVKDLQEGDIVTVQGILGDIKNIYTKYGKRLTQATLVDTTDSLAIIWFNSHYLKKTLKPNHRYNLSGKIGKFSSKITMIAPEFEEVGNQNVSTGRLVPIYPETAGVSSKWLRNKISDILQKNIIIEEFLPKQILQEEQFPKLDQALYTFHFPVSRKEAKISKTRFQFEELFLELLKVEKRRTAWEKKLKAVSLSSLIHNEKIQKLHQSLAFALTETQNVAIEEIKNDLKQTCPMNRLLEGDVGTGKTMVAIFAAYITYLNGYNTLYMAPTEILAKQHFETFKSVLDTFKVNLNLNTGSMKIGDKLKTPFILIGTHALLYEKEYEKIGLVVIDEQQRFGVEQRTKLANMTREKVSPHLLTMTATPIPRTLALTLYGDLKISHLDPIPSKEKKVITKIATNKQREQVFEWIRKKGDQTFIVCPFIEESSHQDFENVKAATAEYEKLKSGVFKNVSIGLLHGRMTSKEKHEVVGKFERKEITVLVSTPVIEVGIDIPQASVMVIESGERYGLASLHQLRGRIGRAGQEGVCFVFMSNYNKTAYKRLKYLEEIYEGLQLAEIDMELRGHGDIYGIMQHGFKRFRVARLSDINMLEKSKKWVAEIFKNIDKFPQLNDKIERDSGRFVGNN